MIPDWLRLDRPPLRQAIRVTIGSLIAFAAYRALGFQQGYWAVLTVIIVLQGSIGGTLGAALDRLLGTVAGAVLGGIGILVAPHTPVGTGVAMAIVLLATALAAAVRPQLRIAPVTAAILFLSPRTDPSVGSFVLARVGEIALGGVIGVATSLLVLPARSHAIVVESAANVLTRCAALIRSMADGLRHDGTDRVAHDHAGLRKALNTVEAAMADAERERQSRLAEHGIPDALPRTLWRIRNDIVTISRGLETALPDVPGTALPPIFATMLDAAADFVDRCRAALISGSAVDRGDLDRRHDDFAAAIQALRRGEATSTLDFDAMGRLYGVIFAVEQLHRNLGDLANRIDEAGAAPARRSLFSRRAA